MKDSGSMAKERDLALSILRMATNFMASSVTENREDKEHIIGVLEIFMKEDFLGDVKRDLDTGNQKMNFMEVSGDWASLTDMEFSSKQMGICTKANGVCSKDMGEAYKQPVRLFMWVGSPKVSTMVLANCMKEIVFMKAILNKAQKKGRGYGETI